MSWLKSATGAVKEAKAAQRVAAKEAEMKRLWDAKNWIDSVLPARQAEDRVPHPAGDIIHLCRSDLNDQLAMDVLQMLYNDGVAQSPMLFDMLHNRVAVIDSQLVRWIGLTGKHNAFADRMTFAGTDYLLVLYPKNE